MNLKSDFWKGFLVPYIDILKSSQEVVLIEFLK